MGVALSAGTTQTEMVRLVNDQLVKMPMKREDYLVPPKALYKFMVTGYALPFEMPKAAEYGGGMQTMTRIEFTITEGKGAGKQFTQMWGFSIGERSNLGKFLRKLGVDLTPDPVTGTWDLDRAIGYTGMGFVSPSDKLGDDGKPKNAVLSLDTVDPDQPPKKQYRINLSDEDMTPKSNGSGAAAASSDDGWPDD